MRRLPWTDATPEDGLTCCIGTVALMGPLIPLPSPPTMVPALPVAGRVAVADPMRGRDPDRTRPGVAETPTLDADGVLVAVGRAEAVATLVAVPTLVADGVTGCATRTGAGVTAGLLTPTLTGVGVVGAATAVAVDFATT